MRFLMTGEELKDDGLWELFCKIRGIDSKKSSLTDEYNILPEESEELGINVSVYPHRDYFGCYGTHVDLFKWKIQFLTDHIHYFYFFSPPVIGTIMPIIHEPWGRRAESPIQYARVNEVVKGVVHLDRVEVNPVPKQFVMYADWENISDVAKVVFPHHFFRHHPEYESILLKQMNFEDWTRPDNPTEYVIYPVSEEEYQKVK